MKGSTMSINSAGTMPDDVTLEWNTIWSAVCELHWFWKFQSDLCGNAQHVALMQDILPFPFMLIRKILLFSITMGIGRLLDAAEYKKRPNLSFARLLKTI